MEADGENVLSEKELRILDACANGPGLFYFPFAEVNFGGQVVPAQWREPGNSSFERYEDEGPWGIPHPGEEVASDIAGLTEKGLLRCESMGDSKPRDGDFSMYAGYSCVTWDDHFDRFGYGPHKFTTTRKGLAEVSRREQENQYWFRLALRRLRTVPCQRVRPGRSASASSPGGYTSGA